jgi:hypothetical protein
MHAGMTQYELDFNPAQAEIQMESSIHMEVYLKQFLNQPVSFSN